MWRYIIGGLVILIAFVTCGGDTERTPEDTFYLGCIGQVEAQLKAPANARFSPTSGQIQANGTRYRWAGYVDSENSFGANIRTRFICEGTATAPSAALF